MKHQQIQQVFPFIPIDDDIENRVQAFKKRLEDSGVTLTGVGMVRSNDPMPAHRLMRHIDRIGRKYH
jgi:hypothetical protein